MKCMPMTLSGPSCGCGDLGDRDRGGVGGQDEIGTGGGIQILEDLEFQLRVFGGGFDDEVCLWQGVIGRNKIDFVRAGFLSGVERPLFH